MTNTCAAIAELVITSVTGVIIGSGGQMLNRALSLRLGGGVLGRGLVAG